MNIGDISKNLALAPLFLPGRFHGCYEREGFAFAGDLAERRFFVSQSHATYFIRS